MDIKEPEKCHFCGSYDMYQGMHEEIGGKMVVCESCLKKN